MSEHKAKHIIKTEQQLSSLINRISNEKFADSFQFDTEELCEAFLEAVIPNNVDFKEKFYYFDNEKKLHISESEEGYFWISTIGLLPIGKFSDNTFVNAFETQKIVLSSLLDSAEAIINSDDVYDIDSYSNEQLKIYTPAIWQNVVFFFELFGKAYLSISGKEVEHSHHISDILEEVKKTMYELYQNDTLFHAYVIPEYEMLSDYIKAIPGKFNEAYIKYDANEQDTTCFPFSKESFNSIRNLISFCEDFILDYFYSHNDPMYLTPGLYNRLIQKAPDDLAKKAVENKWGFLNTSQEDTTNANI